MSETRTVKLGDVCEVIMGQAPKGDTYNTEHRGYPLIAGAGDFDKRGGVSVAKYTTKPTRLSAVGDIILSIRASIGAKVWADDEYCLGRGVAGLRPTPELDAQFLWYWLPTVERLLLSKARGATFIQVNRKDIEDLPIELPSLENQKKFALEKHLQFLIEQKRARQRELLSELEKSVFHQMFGNPFEKNNEYPRYKLLDLSLKFNDGPFGSNLKSEHYQTNGIRVIRLQNIGVDEFKNSDKVFISPAHYEKLKKYTCSPGDIIIATLGNPNLRATEIPSYLHISINKADCIRMRPNLNLVNKKWLIHLLNSDTTINALSTLFHGQTRSRVSMGQLQNIEIHLPPIDLQNKFENITNVK
ncbi:restriction endonuclease subunit S [Rothia amarae]|uniref:restriction endonuclease subunit S n=1 Tax=Rothia amarae TaxID=169480 RepID=UPI0031D1CA14